MGEPHIKGLSSPQEKRMAQVHQNKYLKPKTHERTGLKAHETEGRKEKSPACQDQKIKESPVERIGSRYPEAAKGLGSSGCATQLG